MSQATLSRKVMFQCMHRYDIADWSDEKNLETFGACYSKSGHGHNYELVGFFSGPIDEETGMIINLKDADDILKSAVAPLHQKFLNEEVKEFKSKVPTTENLVLFIATRIQEQLKDHRDIQLSRLRVYECSSLWVDWLYE